MQRSSHSLDALVNPGGWTHRKHFSSIPTSWPLRAATSTPVRPHFPRRHPITTPVAFSFSDCIQTDLKGGLPADVEPFFDLDGCGLDSDFDDTIEGDPVVPQAQDSSDASKPPQKSIKTYVIKHMAYTTSVAESREVPVP